MADKQNYMSPEWEWQPIRNGKGHYWFLKPKYNRSAKEYEKASKVKEKNERIMGRKVSS